MKAPTREEVRCSEEQNEIMAFEGIKKRKQAEQNEVDKVNRKNAMQVIEQLSKMFQDKKVSGLKGCSICGIPPEICSEKVLEIINEYLGGEWFAEFEFNTGNAHDFEVTNTLRVKPRI